MRGLLLPLVGTALSLLAVVVLTSELEEDVSSLESPPRGRRFLPAIPADDENGRGHPHPGSHPNTRRLIVVGDLHGDLKAAQRALRLAGVVCGKGPDDRAEWCGGDATVVSVGDQIDRGKDDRAVLELFHALGPLAAMAGGRVVALLGDHEVLNAELSWAYVHTGAFGPFQNRGGPAPDAVLKALPPEIRAAKDAKFGRGVWEVSGLPREQSSTDSPIVLMLHRAVNP